MTKYILHSTYIPTLSKKKPRSIIVLCHGYGGDGKDISGLAMNWQHFLTDTAFLCPDAPEVCSINQQGYQWFDLSSEKEEILLEKTEIAEKKLNEYLDQVLNNFELSGDNLALVGFSQGCMMGIEVSLKREKKINCLIGFSGKIISKKNLDGKIKSKPKIFLMHGENDTICSPVYLLEAKEYLNNHGLKIKTKLFKNCEHTIPVEGSSLGLAFLKKNLL